MSGYFNYFLKFRLKCAGTAWLFLLLFLVGCASQPESVELAPVMVGEVDASDSDGAGVDLQQAAMAEAEAEVGLAVASPDQSVNLDAAPAANTEQVPAQAQKPQYNKSDVIWIQQRLKDLGYYQGPVDGSVGKATRGAVMEYQREQDVNADGQPTTELREFMWLNGG